MSVVPNYLAAPLLTPKHTSAMPRDDVSENNMSPVLKEDKLPHDASVFVGSLPSNIDQGDLTRMLIEHLSEHTQIKNIKVVRDTKGGVCAFVQCENATSATDLIQTLHSRPPNLFMGRILRYEPARAFRTLLVSYRGPTQIVRLNLIDGASYPAAESTEMPLDLPNAMRVWKHRNSRFHSIMYNSDAIQAEETSSRAGLSSDNAIFIHPLKFDEETLRKLASYFGPLEKFNVLEIPMSADRSRSSTNGLDSEGEEGSTAHQEPSQYPSPHDASRSPSMDSLCWEVKWEHRDDCVSALMTLKRVPHLTVTWAHQPPPVSNTSGSYYPPSPTSYSIHPQRLIASPQFLALGHARQRSSLQQGLHDPAAGANVPNQNGQPESEKRDSDKHEPIRDWSEETDTSYQTDSVTQGDASWDLTACRSSWGKADSSAAIESAKGDANGNATSIQPKVVDDSIELGENAIQELYMPRTPGLDATTISPLTPGTQFPITPTSNIGDTTGDVGGKLGIGKDLSLSYNHSRPEREIDPTTLFVGGLEMFGPGAWDEKKVEIFFSRFGGLESVKVVRPVNSCTAFAFVKFNNADSPARAVSEEHNRVYEGRAMRVQLRDCNPPRNNWKAGRGRGRPHQNNFGSQRRLHYKPFDLRGQTSYRFQNDRFNADIAEKKYHSEIQFANLATELPSVGKSQSSDASGMASTDAYNLSATSIPAFERNSPPVEKYREWYDEPESVVHTPEPSSLGSSVSTAGMQMTGTPYAYPVPHGPFFPTQPWIQHYMPQPPYQPQQMPYYPGYPMYPAAPVQSAPIQGVISPPSSDVGAPTMGIQAPWPHVGVYAPYIPYPAVHHRPGMSESNQPSVTTQAPLIPTGFIQNEQGTLIPVYQPEALDQYMASSGVASPPISVSHSSHPPIGSLKGVTSPYPHDVKNLPAGNAVHTTPNQILNKPNLHSTLHSFPNFLPSPTALRGGVDFSLNSPSPLYRRQGQRRENAQQNQSNAVRHHNHPRAHNGRSQRGHMHISAVPDLGHSGIPPTMMGGQWPRWNDAR